MNIMGFSGIANGDYYRESLGLRFVGHDSSVALVVDGKVVFAVEEERLSREKHTSRFPVQALDAALRHTGLRLDDIERAAYTWYASPGRIAHMFTHHAFRVPLPHWPELALAGTRVILDLMWPRRIAHQFGLALGSPLPRCEGVSHHMGHSACAYFTSPFDHAAVLTVDGQGEDESGSLGEWRGTEYRHFRSIYSPDSIGILYGMVTDFLGMRAAWDEYKVMGMAAYGDPERFAPAFRKLVSLRPDGRYRTYRTAMVFKPGYCDRMLSRLLGIPKRGPGEPLGQDHFDVAASLQQTTEEVLFHLLGYLRRRANTRHLCLGGGVFLNSVANGKIRQSGLFEKVHVPSVPGDHGGALGAALLVYHRRSGAPRQDVGFTAFCGPSYSEADIERALETARDSINYVRTNSIGMLHVDDFKAPWADMQALFQKVVRRDSSYRGWYCTHYHQVKPQVREQEEKKLAFVHQRVQSNDLWLGLFREVVQYGQERDTARLEVKSAAVDKIVLSVADEMDDTRFDFPLTVKVRVSPSWKAVRAEQGGRAVEARILEHDGATYALVQVVPDRGDVSLQEQRGCPGALLGGYHHG